MKLNLTILLIACLGITGCAGGVVVGGAATGAAVIHDRRSPGTVIDDQTTKWKIFDRILSDKKLFDASHINIAVYNRSVLLTGETPTEDLKLRAHAYARHTEKVQQVHNEIRIAEPSSLSVRTNDVFLSGKVNAALLNINIEGFDVTRVKVVTENSHVYLMGLLTEQEAKAVTEKARSIKGVKKVIRLFEYISEAG
ncbi:MAG: BON domain-containing protein [Gammaproteobacteria bacterium]|nr:MAG: BON domain-containing protein [Gammaproteobacteria bacterium]